VCGSLCFRLLLGQDVYVNLCVRLLSQKVCDSQVMQTQGTATPV